LPRRLTEPQLHKSWAHSIEGQLRPSSARKFIGRIPGSQRTMTINVINLHQRRCLVSWKNPSLETIEEAARFIDKASSPSARNAASPLPSPAIR
jgi:hypothetical protein